ncbi:xanthine dehydrogenase family protein molybdopterin-binding subunit [Noviherbaspirillum saxi]|uniref:Xanthine dehydrogenase family protein molybdopterin-binding subunit n=1 Tax=Noviherbaspirillum saxi TaxID=2320863 RepID=A0A3A3FHC9_9BURK|nr:xanthine dehydrogenase family protein molybdopterin-binding subunit [Noviherbaspirillum saxi]
MAGQVPRISIRRFLPHLFAMQNTSKKFLRNITTIRQLLIGYHAFPEGSQRDQFVEVHVVEDLGEIRVPRAVGVYGVDKLMNRKTGHSQLMGGIVWGISLALMEKTIMGTRTGRAVNGNLAEYRLPVNADIGTIDVSVADEDDPHVNPLGAKGIGDIGITGVGAAIANAVFPATGKRIRSVPITFDQLL